MKKNSHLIIFFIFIIFLLPNCICQMVIADSKLEIVPPKNIIENESVNITIIANGTPVPDATVIIKDCDSNYFSLIKKSDDNGTITYRSLKISSFSKSYITIIAAKVGYITDETTIHITNIPNLHTSRIDYKALNKNDIFTAVVRDDSQNPINNAEVSIWNRNFTIMYYRNYTDENGEAILRAPTEPGTYVYRSIKAGYVDGEDLLFISSPEESKNFLIVFFYLFLFTIIVVIPVVIFYIVFKKKMRKKK